MRYQDGTPVPGAQPVIRIPGESVCTYSLEASTEHQPGIDGYAPDSDLSRRWECLRSARIMRSPARIIARAPNFRHQGGNRLSLDNRSRISLPWHTGKLVQMAARVPPCFQGSGDELGRHEFRVGVRKWPLIDITHCIMTNGALPAGPPWIPWFQGLMSLSSLELRAMILRMRKKNSSRGQCQFL
jgi:hypothetical protein